MFLTSHSSAFLLHDVRVVKNVACLSSLMENNDVRMDTGYNSAPVRANSLGGPGYVNYQTADITCIFKKSLRIMT